MASLCVVTGAAESTDNGDLELVRRVLAGDRDAFGVIAMRHERMLFSHLYHMTRNADTAQDLAQETLLRAYRKLASYRVTTPFTHWLLRIATNLAIDEFRKTSREKKMMESEAVSASRQGSHEDGVRRTDEQRTVADALARMSPTDAGVLNLHYGEELPVAEIAAIVGKSPGAVKGMLHRARTKLRQLLIGLDQDGKP